MLLLESNYVLPLLKAYVIPFSHSTVGFYFGNCVVLAIHELDLVDPVLAGLYSNLSDLDIVWNLTCILALIYA